MASLSITLTTSDVESCLASGWRSEKKKQFAYYALVLLQQITRGIGQMVALSLVLKCKKKLSSTAIQDKI